MPRSLAALGLAVVCAARPAAAQTATFLHPSPTDGLTLPGLASAVADRATAPGVSPSGLGFLRGGELDYFHEGFGSATLGGDGLYLAEGLGGLSLGYGVEWVRPDGCGATGVSLNGMVSGVSPGGPGPCYRRQTFSAATSAGKFFSLGASYATFSSADSAAQDNLGAWSFGAGLRTRLVSLSVNALDANAPRFGATTLPRRWDFGAGLRLPQTDRVTLGVDWLLRECGTATGPCGPDGALWSASLTGEVVRGLTLFAQGTRDLGLGATGFTLGVTLDFGNAGVTFGSAVVPGGSTQALGVRFSSDRWSSLVSGPSTAAKIDLDQALASGSGGALSLVFGGGKADPFLDLLGDLRALERDTTVRAVVFRTAGLPLGMGRAEELRAEMLRLKAAGKKLAFYLVSGGDLDYYVASAADRILVAPQAMLLINGFSASAMFAAGTLGKLGVKVQAVRVGAYKNAPDEFTRGDMSPEQREVDEALLDDLDRRYVSAVVKSRNVEERAFRTLLDKGIVTGAELKEKGLIDAIAYPDELEAAAKALAGTDVRLADAAVPEARDLRWGERPRIAIIRVVGDIVGGRSRSSPLGGSVAGAETIAAQIRAAASSPLVKAIVLRVDSPGGDGLASDLIWRELKQAKDVQHKPCVASMGDVAASGGYYVAVGCEEIFAEPSTVTGSIGVFALKPDASGLMEKLGVKQETLVRGKSADLFSLSRPWTDDELKTLQAWVDQFYDQFLDRVAAGRPLKKDEIDKIARGRVWSGQEALERHLVDHLGSIDDAVASAKAKAGLAADAEVDVVTVGGDGSLLDLGATDDADARALAALSAGATPEVRAALREAWRVAHTPSGPQAAMPYSLEIH